MVQSYIGCSQFTESVLLKCSQQYHSNQSIIYRVFNEFQTSKKKGRKGRKVKSKLSNILGNDSESK
jgi:nucleoid DNA-binding protein